uniref:Protein kinase domain-containing protein n=1 Tax=Chromera velia CCMP2878 TaxID=1169474 RepID=A0A0G4HD52_9ALVE|eukprot:Cvel_6403.t1-p1 / transcript=Cvel_6403.t1 / gene=Cvel_6403 / organism=Chromera_velia_CCMP2878 / gene_product=hypothetical protein / transcript_product=hypothetical protein / location=Cvel_scaffold313:12874-16553(+) / protein_length=400 / sequence_SO=supercontig / SO=protein_coding / is_pseudo=false
MYANPFFVSVSSLESSCEYHVFRINASMCSLFSPTRASRLYLLLLRLLSRDYSKIFQLAWTIGADTILTREEENILKFIAYAQDAHPDAVVCAARMSLLAADAPVAPEWHVPTLAAAYLLCLPHTSVSCRMDAMEEARFMSIASEYSALMDQVNAREKSYLFSAIRDKVFEKRVRFLDRKKGVPRENKLMDEVFEGGWVGEGEDLGWEEREREFKSEVQRLRRALKEEKARGKEKKKGGEEENLRAEEENRALRGRLRKLRREKEKTEEREKEGRERLEAIQKRTEELEEALRKGIEGERKLKEVEREREKEREIWKRVRRMNNWEASRKLLDFAKGAAVALKALHDQGYLDLDAKLENLVVGRDGALKLIDFGSSAKAQQHPHFEGEEVALIPAGIEVH